MFSYTNDFIPENALNFDLKQIIIIRLKKLGQRISKVVFRAACDPKKPFWLLPVVFLQ